MLQMGWLSVPRNDWIQRLEREVFDLIVIGGGITGAGTAREAALAGLKVALLEAGDFANATSSRSTKLIHGGLRYLAQGELGLVRETGRERAVLQSLAPHLISSAPVLLPIYKGMPHGLKTMSAALWLYDLLAGVNSKERRRILSAEEVSKDFSGLRQSGLRGGVLYCEYITDDARLTLSTLQSAAEWGAVTMNYCRAAGITKSEGGMAVVKAVDLFSGREVSVKGRVIVNATGPWVDEILAWEGTGSRQLGREVIFSRGIHISLPSEYIGIKAVLAIQSTDKRLVFVIPKGNVTYIGTTDHYYQGDISSPGAPEEDIKYLLSEAKRVLPQARLERDLICGIWSGVRTLFGEGSKEAKELSRRDEIWVTPAGHITVAGGKLTAYRKMAGRVLQHVVDQLEKSDKPYRGDWPSSKSSQVALYGAKTVPRDLQHWSETEADRLNSIYGVSNEDSPMLIGRYGDQVEKVLGYAKRQGTANPAARIHRDYPLVEGEIPYLVGMEMAGHLADVICRRTQLGRFFGLKLHPLIDKVAERMAELMGWGDETRLMEIERCFHECYPHGP